MPAPTSDTLFQICAPILTLSAVLFLIWKASWSNVENISKNSINDYSTEQKPRFVRSLILRCVAFSTALYQFEGAWAKDGILPVGKYMEKLGGKVGVNAFSSNNPPSNPNDSGFIQSLQNTFTASSVTKAYSFTVESINNSEFFSSVLTVLSTDDNNINSFIKVISSSQATQAFYRFLVRMQMVPTLLWLDYFWLEAKFGQVKTEQLYMKIENRQKYVEIVPVMETALQKYLYIGVGISCFVFLFSSNYILLLFLYLIKLSLVNVGQRFMAYGWHPQFLEFGLLCVLLGEINLFSSRRSSNSSTNVGRDQAYYSSYLNIFPEKIAIFLLRFLLFRCMFEPGVGKLEITVGGDTSWTDLSAMHYHYWTQPSVNALSYFLHGLPKMLLSGFTACNHLIEVAVPFLIFGDFFAYVFVECPLKIILGRKFEMKKLSAFARYCRIFAGVACIMFQVVLLLGGNYSYLSYLTLFQSFCCFDDELFSTRKANMNIGIDAVKNPGTGADRGGNDIPIDKKDIGKDKTSSSSDDLKSTAEISKSKVSTHQPITISELTSTMVSVSKSTIYIIFSAYIFSLAYTPLSTVLTGGRVADTSFSNWHLVNGYGAFSHMTKDRREILIRADVVDTTKVNENNPSKLEKKQIFLDFVSKPGSNLKKPPTSIAPFDWFVDWSLWFVPLSGPPGDTWKAHPWFLRMIYKLKMKEPSVWALVVPVEQKNSVNSKEKIHEVLFDTVTKSYDETAKFLENLEILKITVDSARYEFAYGDSENYWKRSDVVTELEFDLEPGGLGEYLVHH